MMPVRRYCARVVVEKSAAAESGPMMLQQAALDAIRMARYRPYLLNGLPTEVDTTFVVNFRLGS